jgi:hypothetical protein
MAKYDRKTDLGHGSKLTPEMITRFCELVRLHPGASRDVIADSAGITART